MIVRLTFELEVNDQGMREYIAEFGDLCFEEPPTPADVLIDVAQDARQMAWGPGLVVSMVAHGVDDPDL